MSNPIPEPVRLDPSKAYGRYDRPNPDLALPSTDPAWEVAAHRLRKAASAEAEGRLADRDYHLETAELHIQGLLATYGLTSDSHQV